MHRCREEEAQRVQRSPALGPSRGGDSIGGESPPRPPSGGAATPLVAERLSERDAELGLGPKTEPDAPEPDERARLRAAEGALNGDAPTAALTGPTPDELVAIVETAVGMIATPATDDGDPLGSLSSSERGALKALAPAALPYLGKWIGGGSGVLGAIGFGCVALVCIRRQLAAKRAARAAELAQQRAAQAAGPFVPPTTKQPAQPRAAKQRGFPGPPGNPAGAPGGTAA